MFRTAPTMISGIKHELFIETLQVSLPCILTELTDIQTPVKKIFINFFCKNIKGQLPETSLMEVIVYSPSNPSGVIHL